MLLQRIAEAVGNIVLPLYTYLLTEVVYFFTKRKRRYRYITDIRRLHHDLTAKVKLCDIKDLCETNHPIDFKGLLWDRGNISPYEMYCLCAFIRSFGVKRIFEIGTFNGNTTFQMAVNSPEECEIFTLDLGEGTAKAVSLPLAEKDRDYIRMKSSMRKAYKGTAYEKKIRELEGDSATFDYGGFRNSIDLVFVDGAHSYEYVASDTTNALAMVSPKGIIAWHDYTVDDGVTRLLDELGAQKELYHIEMTNLVVYFHNREYPGKGI